MASKYDPVEEYRRLIKSPVVTGQTGQTGIVKRANAPIAQMPEALTSFTPDTKTLKKKNYDPEAQVAEFRKLKSKAWSGYERQQLYEGAANMRLVDTRTRLQEFQDKYSGILDAGSQDKYQPASAYDEMIKRLQAGVQSVEANTAFFREAPVRDQLLYQTNNEYRDYYAQALKAAEKQRKFYGQFSDEAEYKKYEQQQSTAQKPYDDRQVAEMLSLYEATDKMIADQIRQLTDGYDQRQVRHEQLINEQAGYAHGLISEEQYLKNQAELDQLNQTEQDFMGKLKELETQREMVRQEQAQFNDLKKARQVEKEYDVYRSTPEYYAQSKYNPAATSKYNQDQKLIYDFVNSDEEGRQKILLTGITFSSMGGVEPVYTRRGVDTLTPDEIKTYNYLFNTKGGDAAEAYLKKKEPVLLARRAEKNNTRMVEFAEKTPGLATAASFATNLIGAVTAPVQLVSTLFGADKNDPIFDINKQTGAIRSTVAPMWDKALDNVKIPIINQPAGSFLYNAMTSTVDSGIAILLGGAIGAPNVSLGIMSSSAAGSTIHDALQKGLPNGKAALMGLIAGGMEAITEKFSLDALFSRNNKSIARYLFKNMGVEASEELASSVGNMLADSLINGKQSDVWQSTYKLMRDKGLSADEAHKEALSEWMKQAGAEALSGALSGLVFAGAGSISVAQDINQRKIDTLSGSIMSDAGMGLKTPEIERLTGQSLVDQLYGVQPKDLEEPEEPTISTISNIPEVSEVSEVSQPAEEAGKSVNKREITLSDGKKVNIKTQADLSLMEGHREKNTELDDDTYAYAMETAYNAGLSGSKALLESSEAVKKLNPETARTVFEAGKLLYDEKSGIRQKKAETLKSGLKPRGAGTIKMTADVSKLDKTQKDMAFSLSRFTRITGLDIEIYASQPDEKGVLQGEQGSFDPKTGRFRFDINAGLQYIQQAKNPQVAASLYTLPRVMGHEFTHFLQATTPELYTAYQEAVLSRQITAGNSVDELIRAKMERAKLATLSVADAMDEVIADASEMMLQNTKAFQEIMSENKSLWEKFMEWFAEFAKAMKDRLGRIGPGFAEAKALMEVRDSVLQVMDEYQKQWDAMMKSSLFAPKRTEVQAKAAPVKPVVEPEAAPPSIPLKTSNMGIAYTPDNTPVKFRYKVASLNDLITSHNDDFTENPAYPADMQPRDRTRSALKDQVLEIAEKLNPARLGENVNVGDGAPIVGPDNMVEVGNGRIMALRAAMASYPNSMKKYTAWLKENAAAFGIGPRSISKNSVLVRERIDEAGFDRASYTQKANVPTTATQSETENAEVDAGKLDSALLASVQIRGGELNTSGSNHFIVEFVRRVIPKNERNAFVDADGNLSQRGETRLRNALFQLAYGDTRLTAQLAEAVDKQAVNVFKAITNIAPRIALMKEDVAKGRLLDLVPVDEIVKAYQAYNNLKQNGGDVEAYLAQLSMVKLDTEAVKMLVGVFEENKNAPARMTDVLNTVLDVVSEIGDPNQIVMPGFERTEESMASVVSRGLNRYAQEEVKYSERDMQDKVNASMPMDRARQMIERAFILGNVKEWYEGQYSNAQEWLRGEGPDSVALIIDNTRELHSKYINPIVGIMNDEFSSVDIVNAYLKGTLTGEVKHAEVSRIDRAEEPKKRLDAFYSPKEISDAKAAYEIANTRATKTNSDAVNRARADVLMFAHNKGAAELLGITQAELNKRLRSWSAYPAAAREISIRINEGAELANRWTGIENLSFVNRVTVTRNDLARFVKDIVGESDAYDYKYIVRTLLALDTQIDYSGLTFIFERSPKSQGKTVNGFYDYDSNQIHVKYNAPHTVAHEIGHAIDYLWGKELTGFSIPLSDMSGRGRISDNRVKQFVANFDAFLDSISDRSDISSAYTQRGTEVLARFVARFVEWADNTATGRETQREYSYYNDNFRRSDFLEFAMLLQEKSAINGIEAPSMREYIHNSSIKYSLREYSDHQLENWKNSKRIVVYDGPESLSIFVKKAINEPDYKAKMYFGVIPDDLADKVMEETSVDVNGLNLSLAAEEIRKILNEHGDAHKEALRGQRAITPDDFALIRDVVELHDIVKKSAKGRYGKPAVEFEKYINGRVFVIAVVSDKHMDLSVQTMYAGVKKRGLATASGERAPNNTPEATSGTASFKESIPPTDSDSQVKRSERDFENELPNARAILAGAFGNVARTNAECRRIKEYRRNADRVNHLETALKDLEEKRRNLYNSKGPQEEKNTVRKDIQAIKDQIQAADRVLFSLEMSEPLRNVVKREREKAEKMIRARAQEKSAEYREKVRDRYGKKFEDWKEKEKAREAEREERHSHRDNIKKIAKDLSDWVTNPTGKKHVPEVLRGAIGDFILSVNEQSKRAAIGGADTNEDRRFYDRLDALNKAIVRVQQQQDSDTGEFIDNVYEGVSGHLDIPAEFTNRLGEIVDQVKALIESHAGEHVLALMNVEQLKVLDEAMIALYHSVRQMNDLIANQAFKHVDEIGKATFRELSGMKSKLNRTGKIDGFFNWDNTLPVYAFDRLKSAGKAIFRGFMQGQDRMAKNSKQIVDFAESTFTDKEAREWEKELHTFTVEGKEVRMTTAHVMALHALNKREQARGHLYGGGVRVDDIKVNNKTLVDPGHVLLPEDVNRMLAALTPRQVEVADALQNFMSTVGSSWGNQISMVRFGVKLFGEENYFPIESSKLILDEKAESPEGNPLYRLLNLSMTKGLTARANNQIMLHNIFDVFSSHMADMAQYNAFALPVLDAVKWYNYHESYKELDTGRKRVTSVRGTMRSAYGDSALRYVTQLLRDINGARMSGSSTGQSLALTVLRRYNRSVVAANLRVALLQPTSIMRALNVIGARYLATGSIKNLARMKNNIKEMEQHSGISAWKQLGFYDVNMSRSLQEMIKRDNGLFDWITEKTMKLPQMMDRITWSAIWESAKNQIAAQNPGIDTASSDFFDKVTALFNDTIYRTQVVDSMLTRSDYMRKQDYVAKYTSSFMSEPTMAYNILAAKVHQFNDDVASGMSKGQAWSKNGRTIVRGITAYALTATLVTIVEALATAWRDDDEYATFMEKVMKAMGSNALDNFMPINLPLVNEIWSVAKRYAGLNNYADKAPLTEGLDALLSGIEGVRKQAAGEAGKTTAYGTAYRMLQGVSYVTGVPFAPFTREVVDLWNGTAGAMYPQYKILRKEPSKKSGIDALVKAILDHDADRETEIRTIIARQGIDEKAVWAGVRGGIRDEYKTGDLTIDEAKQILNANKGSVETDTYWLTKEWEARKERGEWGEEYKYSRYDNFLGAILTGDKLKDYAKELVDHYTGKPENMAGTLGSAITNAYKDQYIETYKRSRAEASTLKAKLLNAYMLIGYKDRAAKGKEIDKWLKK